MRLNETCLESGHVHQQRLNSWIHVDLIWRQVPICYAWLMLKMNITSRGHLNPRLNDLNSAVFHAQLRAEQIILLLAECLVFRTINCGSLSRYRLETPRHWLVRGVGVNLESCICCSHGRYNFDKPATRSRLFLTPLLNDANNSHSLSAFHSWYILIVSSFMFSGLLKSVSWKNNKCWIWNHDPFK